MGLASQQKCSISCIKSLFNDEAVALNGTAELLHGQHSSERGIKMKDCTKDAGEGEDLDHPAVDRPCLCE